MTVLIGLHGRLGAGKDTAFEGIHKWASERGVRAARRGFADALKLSFARLFIPDCGLDEAVNWCNTLKGHRRVSDFLRDSEVARTNFFRYATGIWPRILRDLEKELAEPA